MLEPTGVRNTKTHIAMSLMCLNRNIVTRIAMVTHAAILQMPMVIKNDTKDTKALEINPEKMDIAKELW